MRERWYSRVAGKLVFRPKPVGCSRASERFGPFGTAPAPQERALLKGPQNTNAGPIPQKFAAEPPVEGSAVREVRPEQEARPVFPIDAHRSSQAHGPSPGREVS